MVVQCVSMCTLLLITLGFPPTIGGIQRLMGRRARLASDAIVVLAPEEPGCQNYDPSCPFPVYRWPSWGGHIPGMKRLLQMFWSLWFGWRLLRHYPITGIECGQSLPFGLVALVLRWLTGTPYAVWAYGDDICKPSRWPLVRPLLQSVLSQATQIYAISQATGQVLRHLGVPDGQVMIIHPWADPSVFTPTGPDVRSRYQLGERPTVVTVARLEQRKGVHLLLQAMTVVCQHMPDAVLLVVGDGSQQIPLLSLRDSLGLHDNVIFVGAVDDALLPAYYRAGHVFALAPTPDVDRGEMEGFGLVYIEASACGLPTVGLHTGGVAEAVLDGVTGLLVREADPKAIGAAIVRLLTEPDLARRLGAAGRARAVVLAAAAGGGLDWAGR
ncbi:MAG TPA: glycosyltransferase family 1 protein [Anaerolineae bacterium]|nr:glycosyltransferase family 1 protein [Anaerolineae bacterium]